MSFAPGSDNIDLERRWISLIHEFRHSLSANSHDSSDDWKVSICNEGNHFRRTSRVLIAGRDTRVCRTSRACKSKRTTFSPRF